MAPTQTESLLSRRYYCDYNGYCYNSTWNDWGRWAALGVIICVVIILAFIFSCFNSRRRRRRGLQPMYGTGWMANKPQQGQYGNTQNYYPNQPYNNGPHAPAPPYSPGPIGNQQTGNTFNSNDGYYGAPHGQYGGEQPGFELQQPQNSYQPPRGVGGSNVYEAPMGPPPGKGDHIIR